MANGLYANINAKRKRIAAGSGEKMNKVGSKAAPSKMDFVNSAKTAKPLPVRGSRTATNKTKKSTKGY
jgi:hypothetical protein